MRFIITSSSSRDSLPLKPQSTSVTPNAAGAAGAASAASAAREAGEREKEGHTSCRRESASETEVWASCG